MLDRGRPRPGDQLASASPQLAQIALEQRVRVEPDAAPVGDSMHCVGFEQRAQLVDARLIQSLELGKEGNVGIELVERVAFILPGEDQHRHRPADRHLGKVLGRIVEEAAAGEGQRTHQSIAQRIMKHGRAPPRRMETDLLLGFEHDDLRLVGQCGSRGQPGNPTADDQNVGAIRHARNQAAVSRSLTIFPSLVRRMPLTISSSSGSTGVPLSLSQKALRKL